MLIKSFVKSMWWQIEYTYKYERCYHNELKAFITFLLAMLIVPFIIPLDVVLLPFELLFILFNKVMKKVLDK